MAREWRTDGTALCVTAVLCVGSVGPVLVRDRQTSGPATVRVAVSYRARAVAPGEVVRVRVESSVPVETMSGRSPAGPVHFSQSSSPTVWEGFAGLDLGVKPGRYPITVRASAGGVVVKETLTLSVLARRFPVRRITVADRFARPPASALARIEREAHEMAAILAAVSPGRAWDGAFLLPVPGRMSSPFGRLSIVNGEARSPHSGTDFAAAVGTPVTAPNAGRVVLSADLYYAGDTIMIDHGLGVYSLLAHLSRRDVHVGDVVVAGQRVGLSGVTGRITGPHLHWSVRLAGARVDPLSLVEASGRTDPGLVWRAGRDHATLW